MILLLVFAFIAGIVTILSPCILPILPIVLSSGFGDQKLSRSRPIGIVVGFIASFTFFTLFLSTLVRLSGIPADTLRLLSVIIIASFGISLLIPKFQQLLERVFTSLSQIMPTGNTKPGFISGILVGVSLGLLWTPCVGPILASVITLAATSSVTLGAFFITLSYSVGTSIPLLTIMLGGRTLLQKHPWFIENSGRVQKIFGIIMILTAIAIFTNLDRRFQSFILDKFPQYGVGLTKFENTDFIKNNLKFLTGGEVEEKDMGKPLFDIDAQKPQAPEFILGGQWFNLPAGEEGPEPLAIQGLRGKVVLVDFWTYTCINCIRTLPYLKTWHKKYKDKGLVIVGVHTPEFEFEKNPQNVSKAIEDFDLMYPVMQDNNFATWKAYKNQYWPAKYLIDKNGVIVYTHFGEGEYDETERKIQELLAETGAEITESVQNPAYIVQSRTPELYLGLNRMQYFDSNPAPKLNTVENYALKGMQPAKNRFGFVGGWTIGEEYSRPSKGSSLQLTFEAKNVYLVMRRIDESAPSRVIVRLDGSPVSQDYFGGKDIVQEEQVHLDTDRLYDLIKLESPGVHHLYLEFLDGNTEIFAFTFG